MYYNISIYMSTISSSKNTTRNMATGPGNGQLTTSNSTSDNFRTPARVRAREDTDFAYSISRTRTSLGSMTFAQHVRSKSASVLKTYLVDWHDEQSELPAVLPTSSGGADPGAPAPIQGTITVRTNEIYKPNRRATSLKKPLDRFCNTFKFHPNLFTIHNSPIYKLPYPGAMKVQQTISEAILSYSIMSKADQLDLEAEDQNRSSTSDISFAVSRVSRFLEHPGRK